MSFDVYDADYYERGMKTGKSNYRDYSWKRLGRHFTETAIHIINHFSPKTALDVGCAKGLLVYALAQRGVGAQGIDPSEYAVKNAATDRVTHGTVQQIPFDDNTFDLVTCFDVLEHVHEKDALQACRELLRVSRGLVVVTVLTQHVAHDIDVTHCNIKPLAWWEDMFRLAGGSIKPAVKYRKSGVWWFSEPDYLPLVIVTK